MLSRNHWWVLAMAGGCICIAITELLLPHSLGFENRWLVLFGAYLVGYFSVLYVGAKRTAK